MNLTTEYSAWFILLCLVIGVAYGAILYFRNKNDELPERLKRWLFALRSVAVAFIAFLLLGPMIKQMASKDIKPTIILATDASLSMTKALNEQQLASLKEESLLMAEKLSERYEVQSYIFGSEVANKPCDSFFMPLTNMGNLFEEIDIQYKNTNLGALVLVSDGINNSGKDPVYAAAPLEASIYTVGVGDTTLRMDMSISNVAYNKTTYKKNLFPVQVMVQGQMAAGVKTTLRIKKEERVLEERPIAITSNRFSSTYIFYLHADSVGFYRYRLELEPLEEEQNSGNNYKEFVVEVLDRKQKALILADAPHPDLGMLRRVLEQSSFEVESGIGNRLPPTLPVEQFDLVVLHALPSLRTPIDTLFRRCNEARIPLLFILGNNTNFARFNNLQTGLAITPQRTLKEEALPVRNPSFSSFLLDNSAIEDFNKWGPLIVPFGEYKAANSLSVLFYQKIGSVETNYPLVAYNTNLTGKYGFICGEGIWRWRMDSERRNKNTRHVDDFIMKSVQLLLSDDHYKQFRVHAEKEYTAYEHAIFRAELYNKSQEPIVGEEIKLIVRDESGHEYDFLFGVEGVNYKLDAGTFAPGIYQWSATAKVGIESFTEKGTFTILSSMIEMEQTTANHHLLMDIASRHNGKFYSFDELSNVADDLLARTDLKPVRVSTTDYFSLINIKWLLFVIAAMLFAEWFLRKFFGSY